jgi:hypothetical protein
MMIMTMRMMMMVMMMMMMIMIVHLQVIVWRNEVLGCLLYLHDTHHINNGIM